MVCDGKEPEWLKANCTKEVVGFPALEAWTTEMKLVTDDQREARIAAEEAAEQKIIEDRFKIVKAIETAKQNCMLPPDPGANANCTL